MVKNKVKVLKKNTDELKKNKDDLKKKKKSNKLIESDESDDDKSDKSDKSSVNTDTENIVTEDEDVVSEDYVEPEKTDAQTGGEDDEEEINDEGSHDEDIQDADDEEIEEGLQEEAGNDAGEEEPSGPVETCGKNNLKRKKVDFIDSLEAEEISNVPKDEKRISDEDRLMYPPPMLTKYELPRIIGVRTTQITKGAKVYLTHCEDLTPEEIAIEEVRHRVNGLVIKRKYPNNFYEIYKLSELEVDDTLLLMTKQ